MRLRIVSVFSAMIALAWSVQFAQAGAIRYAGKQIHKGSVAAIQKTSDAAGTAAGSVEDAGKATGTALKGGAATLRKSTVSAPGNAVRGTKAAASKIMNAIW
ncbi:MAG TPA: hypothetical protein VEO19_07240 [Terriglobia bacterium]|nr:hypothetical protein [Terriglobia bacterium]